MGIGWGGVVNGDRKAQMMFQSTFPNSLSEQSAQLAVVSQDKH
jgi:hypothetical protein